MADGIYSALSGAMANLTQLDSLANNLANVSSVGFKEDRLLFQEALQRARPRPIGNAQVVLRGTAVDTTQGPLERTGNAFDLALAGDGFFVVQTPGGPRFTRRGDFRVTADGRVVTETGAALLGERGPLRLPPGEASVEESGEVRVAGEHVDRIRVVRLPPLSLGKEGSALFASSARPQPSDARVLAGHLERSNVSPVGAMTQMIVASRAFEIALQSIQNHRRLDERLVSEAGRGA